MKNEGAVRRRQNEGWADEIPSGKEMGWNT